ncbi:MAG: hypothetical protein IJQ80_04585, partial [Clostridia bacterium]|nr:hypothetical protein [Clostridia bacterium]
MNDIKADIEKDTAGAAAAVEVLSREKEKKVPGIKKYPKLCFVLRCALFLVVFSALFLLLNKVFMPKWHDWNNYDTVRGIYEEPDDTLQTLFLGSSYCLNAVNPMVLYDEYGICAYNFSTEEQPLLASYYWLEEAYRLHSATLSTVFLDVSMLKERPSDSAYRKSLDPMKFSSNKLRAMQAYTGDAHDTVIDMLPLMSYHDRWSELETDDFDVIDPYVNSCVRGYYYFTGRLVFEKDFTEIYVPNYYPEYGDETKQLDTEALYYLNRMIGFCKEKGIKFVLMRTPSPADWSIPFHNAVSAIAEEASIEFLDFNYGDILDDIGYVHAADTYDGSHLNYYGATKFTKWLGNYLVEECGVKSVKGQEKYAYLEEQLDTYRKTILSEAELLTFSDPADYIEAVLKNENYTAFITVKDDAATALTDEQRERFAQLGLSGLSAIEYGESYIAVIDRGAVSYELLDTTPAVAKGSFKDASEINDISPDEVASERDSEAENHPVTYSGQLANKIIYELKSGGISFGGVSSCVIDGTEYSYKGRGLNIVVYDNAKESVVNTALFDTFASPTRSVEGDIEALLDEALKNGTDPADLSADLKKLYLYNRRCESARLEGALRIDAEGDAAKYISGFCD